MATDKSDSYVDRVPPHNAEAEMAVLGSMILDREFVGDVVHILNRESFYDTRHQLIFEILVSLWESNRPTDSIILREELAKQGCLEKVGGFEYVGELMICVPSSAHGIHYAHIVREKAVTRNLINVSNKILRDCYDGKEEANKLLDGAEHLIFKVSETRRIGSGGFHIREILPPVMAQIDSWAEHDGRVVGISTGFTDIDTMTSGLQPAQLVIVAGRPSMGKTSFALNIALHVAVNEKKPVAIFSLEMVKEQVVQNLLCMHSRIDSHRMRSGTLAKGQYEKLGDACGELSEAPIYIDDVPGVTPLELRSKARRLKAQHDIQILIVDYVQLMSVPNAESRQQEIAEISRLLKGLARELGIPVLACAQLSRAVEMREGNRPRMSDLRESGALEQDADLILMLYREEYYKPKDDNVKGQTDVIIAKQRNGPTGNVQLAFIGQQMRFANLARQAEEPARAAGYDAAEEATPF